MRLIVLTVCALAMSGCVTTRLSSNGISENSPLQANGTTLHTEARKGLWIGVGLGLAAAIAAGQDSTESSETNLECLAVDVC